MDKKAGPMCYIKKPEEKPLKRNKTRDLTNHSALSAFIFQATGNVGAARSSFFLFRSVPFQYVRWFRFGFSHNTKSRRPDGRPLFFFSRPRPNVSRLRRPGAVRAQPCVMFKNQAAVFYRSIKTWGLAKCFRPDKTRAARFLNDFKNFPQKACVLGVWTKVQIVRGRY